MRKNIILIFLLSISFLGLGQKPILKTDLLTPDTISIIFHEHAGCLIDHETFITINSDSKHGKIYSNYANRDNSNMGLLNQGTIDKFLIDSIVELIYKHEIPELKTYQYDSLKPPISTADGHGNCCIYIKKGDYLIEKNIEFPVPIQRANQNGFQLFHRAIFNLSFNQTHFIPLNSLINKSLDPFSMGCEITEKLIRNSALSAIRSIRDTTLVEELINLHKYSEIEESYYIFQHPSINAISGLKSIKAFDYLDTLLEKAIEDEKEPYYLSDIYDAIRNLDSDSTKIHYLRKFLSFDNETLKYKAALSLAWLQDDSGLNILINDLHQEHDYGIGTTLKAIEKLNSNKCINELMKIYHEVIKQDSLYDKNRIITYYLWTINSILGYTYDKKYDFNPPSYYGKNIEAEMKEIDIKYMNYKKTIE